MLNTRSIDLDRILLPGAMLIAALAHIAALGNHLTADSWVFVYPHSLGETFRYFFTSIIPPEDEVYWLRPLPMFLFWLENVIHSGTEWLPQLTNIMFHVLNVFLLWRVVSFMVSGSVRKGENGGGLAAFAACLVYGIHPLTVGAVDWVAARFDVVSVTFGLAGLLYWLRWDADTKNRRSLFIGTALLICSLLSKEQGITFFMAVAFLTLLRMAMKRKDRMRYLPGVIIPVTVAVLLFIYRLIIFGGIGGYVTARHGLSVFPPINYFIALFFPYPNVMEGWSFSWSFWAACIVVAGLAFLLFRQEPRKQYGRVQREYALMLFVLLALGVGTTAPHPGLELDKVLGHAESRFAFVAITALSMLVGLLVSSFRSRQAYLATLAVLTLWGFVSAWRTTVQVQAWHAAGETAHSILTQTMQLVPDPPEESTLILLDIPRDNEQFAYIYGIGLDYALKLAYNRPDLRVLRYPTREELQHANPERDAVVRYVASSGQMERMHGTRVKKSQAPGTTAGTRPMQ